MTTIIFVHGTGVRETGYAEAWGIIENAIIKNKEKFNISDINLVHCYWAEKHGTKLKADGASIPNYINTKGGTNSGDKEPDSVKLWKQLYQDPLYEIRLLLLKPEGFVDNDELETFRSRIKNFTPSSTLQTQLEEGNLDQVFYQAHNEIINSNPYKFLLQKIPNSFQEYYAAIARSIVASAFICCESSNIFTPVRYHPSWRDEIIDAIISELTQNEQEQGGGSFDFGKNLLVQPLKKWGNKLLQQERGALTDKVYPFIGDILYYQAKGQKIRDFIREQIDLYKSQSVVILAHSLGGIACVDMLIDKELPQVKLLITVGSQAPFLYEIDALQTLSYGDPLPNYFPEWLNLYDRRDILSYIGSELELLRGKITDEHIDNKLPFPECHSAYWQNKETWRIIFESLKSKKLVN